MLTCCGSSRPSTVLGWVPAATRIVRAGSTTSSGAAPGLLSTSACEESRSARAQPKRSSRTSSGVSRRRNRSPPPAPSPPLRG
jgi:hypothetical protein